MSARNAYEALDGIIRVLVTDPAEIKTRLQKACGKALILEDDFPTHLRPKWRRMKEKIETHGPRLNVDGSIYMSAQANTLKKIRRVTASNIAVDLLELYLELKCFLEDED